MPAAKIWNAESKHREAVGRSQWLEARGQRSEVSRRGRGLAAVSNSGSPLQGTILSALLAARLADRCVELCALVRHGEQREGDHASQKNQADPCGPACLHLRPAASAIICRFQASQFQLSLAREVFGSGFSFQHFSLRLAITPCGGRESAACWRQTAAAATRRRHRRLY